MSDRDEREEEEENNQRESDQQNDHQENDNGGEDRRENGSQAGEGERKEDGPTTSLLVRNIAYGVRPDDVRRLFTEYGEIRDVYIPNDFYTRKPKGFAFVEFFNYDDAMRAMERMDKFHYEGRELAIEVAKDRRKTPDEMRPKGGGGGRPRGGGDYGRRDHGGYSRGGYGRDAPRGDYGRPYDYDRPPMRQEMGYGRRSRSRSRDHHDRYDYRGGRPDFRGRDDRYYMEGRGQMDGHHRSHSPGYRPRSRSNSRN